VAPSAAVSELVAPSHGASSLEGIYESYAPELRRRCLRLTRDGHAADDLMQEVFARFITRFPVPPTGMNIGGYLHATARNVLWKQLRDSHEVSDGAIETTAGADDDLDRDPERSMLLGEQQSLVRRCAAVLTGRQRRALTLRDVEGRSYDEIGAELGIGTGAVMQVISRARARLRVAVRRANVDLDALAPECKAMLGPLSDYLDGRALATEAGIEAHLATCDSCCQTLASFQEAGSRLRGFLPLVPLGGIISRLGHRSPDSRVADALVPAAAHAPMLARVANVLGGGGGDGPVGAVGIGAMATAAVIAVTGGGIVVAHQVGSGSSHALVAAAAPPPASKAAKASLPRITPGSVVTTPGARRVTLAARSYGHPYSPAAATRTSTPAVTPVHSAAKVPGTPVPAAATPAKALDPTIPATGGRAAPPPATTPDTAPIIGTPAIVTPALQTPAAAPVLPVRVPVVTVPVVTTPPGVTVPPTTPVVPPVQVPAVPLGASASFAVLAGSGVTNTGPTALTGDLGSFPTLAITGLGSLTLGGLNQAGGAVAQQAKTDLVVAYDAAAAKAPTSAITADLGGRTLAPGVYRSGSSIGLTGTVTLDGQGDPNAVFVFQAGSTLTTASASQVDLTNGARACNVFWQVGSSATLGTGSTFRGTILALVSATVTTGVTISGRVLARNGAVTLDSDTITRADC
jgi:RNA polymerase sigma factor (sigma-70 family)